MNRIINLFICIGLVRRRDNGTIRWPVKFAPAWVFKSRREFIAWVRCHGWFYVFRNLPHVIKWEEGRLLPRRWGFGIMGLIEIGDRG